MANRKKKFGRDYFQVRNLRFKPILKPMPKNLRVDPNKAMLKINPIFSPMHEGKFYNRNNKKLRGKKK